MIFRRHHIDNYTIIGNELFNDERLEADEIGVMAYLLSRPDDWEMRRSQLGKRFGFGRHSMRRIVVNLIRFGWVRATTTRIESTGAIHIVYDVYDEPGPELTQSEAKAALSLESSGAADDAHTDAEGEEYSTGGGSRGAAHGGAATGGRQTAPGYIKNLPSTELPSTDSSKARAREFSDLQKIWPADRLLSPSKAEKLFVRLSDRDKAACCDGVEPFLDDCKAKKRIVCDLKTYLDERRWEAVARKPDERPKLWVIRPGTPQWYRWHEYRKIVGLSVRFMESQARIKEPFSAESEWPPPIERRATDPPSELQKEDEKNFHRLG